MYGAVDGLYIYWFTRKDYGEVRQESLAMEELNPSRLGADHPSDPTSLFGCNRVGAPVANHELCSEIAMEVNCSIALSAL